MAGGPSVCHYCGVWLTEPMSAGSGTSRTVDHIVPRSRKGPNAKRNLVPCCHTCNVGKGSMRSACVCSWCVGAWLMFCPERAALHPVCVGLPVREISSVELVLLGTWAAGDLAPVAPAKRKRKPKGHRSAPPTGGGSPLSKVWGGHERGWI